MAVDTTQIKLSVEDRRWEAAQTQILEDNRWTKAAQNSRMGRRTLRD